jgi:hypothetical protein
MICYLSPLQAQAMAGEAKMRRFAQTDPSPDCMCDLPSYAQTFENRLIIASFEAKKYERTHLQSVMLLTLEGEVTREAG